MATCLVFTHIPRPAAEELTTCLQVEKVREILQTHMSEVPVDLAMDALRLSRRQLWNCEQVSAFLGIILHVVRFDARTSMDTMQQSFAYLKGLVLLHSCERPPWTSGIFTPQEVSVTAFCCRSSECLRVRRRSFRISSCSVTSAIIGCSSIFAVSQARSLIYP